MGQSLRVLLIDDDPADSVLIQEAFSLLEQPCTLMVLNSGAAGLAHLISLEHLAPDVVLLDLKMPEPDGFMVLAALKAHPQLQALPIVVFTISTSDEDMRRAYALRANAYVVKDLAFETLCQQVRSLVKFWSLARTVPCPSQSPH
ncbi:response regulator [Deinococcus sp. QL22]|uniref:response regulator n=1 Tax=Deinococcus sp. QL22 TaxID=2939437 RepID=UPI002017F141|nr:response regulator [Deinococcus sp. QL22]UQN09813.1 response regulator [Deinococcus sp. QL22]